MGKNETAVSKDCSRPKPWPCNQATMFKVKSEVCAHWEPDDPLIIALCSCWQGIN